MLINQWSIKKGKVLKTIGLIAALSVFIFHFSDDFSGTMILKTINGNKTKHEKPKFDFINESFSDLPPAAQYLKAINAPFIPYLKNPCWFEKGKSVKSNKYERKSDIEVLRCLPYAFIAPLPKCGSADTKFRVSQHPDVSHNMNGGSWWASGRFDTNFEDGVNMSFDAYLDHFKLGDYLQQKCGLKSSSEAESVSASCKRLVAIDGSASSFWRNFYSIERLKEISKTVGENSSNAYLKEMDASRTNPLGISTIERDGFKFTLADEIHLILPNSRFVVLFREPISRSYSAYKWVGRHDPNISPSGYDSFINKLLKIWNICRETFSVRYCTLTNYSTPALGGNIPVIIGLYSVYLKEWLSVFRRDQILILRSEDFKANMTVGLRDIFKHLNLRTLDESTLQQISKGKNKHDNSAIQIGDMLPQTRQKLRDFYQPFNEELASILNDKRFLWEDIL